MNNRKTVVITLVITMILAYAPTVYAENIDPNNDDSQYAYGENIGWINFESDISEPNVGATVTSVKVTGFIWAENVGWINLNPIVPDDPNYYGVTNSSGKLSGYGFGQNVGWINFAPIVPNDPNDYGVSIDNDGNFEGWAWGAKHWMDQF